jgi:hypothetical protein
VTGNAHLLERVGKLGSCATLTAIDRGYGFESIVFLMWKVCHFIEEK